MENMEIYNKVRSVPDNAKRAIQAGRLKGKTDINPMWRIKALTETFGPCGTGWYVQMADKRIEEGADGVKVAIMDLNLFYKLENGEWSAPVFGTGGNTLVDKEKGGLYTSDEAFKMAYTDALSVCCKMLGVGADVYWEADSTKYTASRQASATPSRGEANRQPPLICECCGKEIRPVKANGKEFSAWAVAKKSFDRFGSRLCWTCSKEQAARQEAAAKESAQIVEMAKNDPPETNEIPPWEEQA